MDGSELCAPRGSAATNAYIFAKLSDKTTLTRHDHRVTTSTYNYVCSLEGFYFALSCTVIRDEECAKRSTVRMPPGPFYTDLFSQRLECASELAGTCAHMLVPLVGDDRLSSKTCSALPQPPETSLLSGIGTTRSLAQTTTTENNNPQVLGLVVRVCMCESLAATMTTITYVNGTHTQIGYHFGQGVAALPVRWFSVYNR